MQKRLLIIFSGILISLMTAGPVFAKETSFAISADETIRELNQNKIFLVDVRRKEDFNILNIPGSLHIPLHFIKTKPYLKTKAVILVNEGFARRDLVAESRSLRQQGFKVFFLPGGVPAWHQAGGMLRGDLTRLQAYTRVTPATLYREMNNDEIAVVDVSSQSTAKAKKLFGDVAHIPFGNSEREKQVFRESIGRKLETESQARMVLYSNSGEDYLEIAQLLGRKGTHSVFYLVGGLQAYKKYTENQALLYKPREERVKSTSCNNCGPVKK